MPNQIPDPSKSFAEQDPLILWTMAVWGEARGESYLAKVGVAWVILNRVRTQPPRYGTGLPGVILKPYQFSSFNLGDPNRAKLLTPLAHGTRETWVDCRNAIIGVNAGEIPDPTHGARFYFSKPILEPPHSWGEVIHTADIDGLKFFKEAA